MQGLPPVSENTSFRLTGALDDHRHPHHEITVPQLTLAIVWISSILVFLLRYPFRKFKRLPRHDVSSVESPRHDVTPVELPRHDVTSIADVENQNDEKCTERANGTIPNNIKQKIQSYSAENVEAVNNADLVDLACRTNTRPPLKNTENEGAVQTLPLSPSLDHIIQHTVTLGGIMLYFFYCDYKKLVPAGERFYTEDTFLFLIFILFLVGSFFTVRPTGDKILSRDQTEEWKGWMQVLFVWYHYFTATEWYNWIRVYIAAYVWMTGFGNFSFFWVRKDFSAWRISKMLFRLNFFVVIICFTVKNDYMLYYICAMHTYWFLTVYVFMATFSSWNTCRYKMTIKLLAYAVFNAILFEVPEVHEHVFRPFRFVLGFTERTHGPMHEWAYRSGLDHWACFIGMLCAYNYPNFEAFMKYLEKDNSVGKTRIFNGTVKAIMVLLLFCLFMTWHQTCLLLPKFTYNTVHPYTSWIPILIYIVLRNLTPELRQCYVEMFAWLGKVTLETYLSQFHVYLQSNAKDLLVYIPGYPLLNFCLATVIYVGISHTVFNLTTQFSAWLLPKDYREMGKRVAIVIAIFTVAFVVALALKSGLFL